MARWAAASRLSISPIASERSSASRTPRTSGIGSVPLPSFEVCSVSFRNGRTAGPASSQPNPPAISTVTTPITTYIGIRLALNRILSARMPIDISSPPSCSNSMVRTRYSAPLTSTVAVPGGNSGNCAPR